MIYFRKLESWSPKRCPLRVAIYARYSSDLQSSRSIDDQVRDCRARAEAEGWERRLRLHGSRGQRRHDTAPGLPNPAGCRAPRRGRHHHGGGLDRLSRDQEHSAALYKRACYHETIIFTLSEGEVEEWHVGIKSVINAAYLTDLAMKTRRGLRGRVLAGASAGGLSYGYDVVPVPEGADRGLRAINPAQAAVVVRILRDYAGGLSPKAIAAALNREGVPGPRGGTWSQSTIYGNRTRGTGILNNELYIGILVWNRLRYVKDPDNKKRHSRPNAPDKIVRVEVLQLSLVGRDLWKAVKDRQAALDAGEGAIEGTPAKLPFWRQQRPTYLLSGLIRCGSCGGGMSVISATHVGCSSARNKGEAVCTNRRTIKRSVLEETVLDALRTRLMSPDVYAAFVRGFTAEWNAAQKGRAVAQEGGARS